MPETETELQKFHTSLINYKPSNPLNDLIKQLIKQLIKINNIVNNPNVDQFSDILLITNVDKYIFVKNKTIWYKLQVGSDNSDYPNIIFTPMKIDDVELNQLLEDKISLEDNIHHKHITLSIHTDTPRGNKQSNPKQITFDYYHYSSNMKIISIDYFKKQLSLNPQPSKGGSRYRRIHNIIKKNLLYNNRKRIDQIKHNIKLS